MNDETQALAVPEEFVMAVYELLPDVTDTAIARCVQAGIRDEALVLAAQLVVKHHTGLTFIARWAESGMSIERIQECLVFRDDCGFEAPSVACLNRYLNSIHFAAESADAILDTFRDIWEAYAKTYPLQWFWYRIDEAFGGDIIRAYHLAVDDPRAFTNVLLGQQTLLHHSLRTTYSEEFGYGGGHQHE